jgi:hypothetical protein
VVSETQSGSVGRFEDPGLLGYADAEIDAMLEGRAVLDGAR